MATKRTAINRAGHNKITPAAIDAFKKMLALEEQCTCPPIDWAGKYWERPGRPCRACKKWKELHSILVHEPRLAPHQWPAYQRLDWETPYPAGSVAAERDKPDLGGQERFRALLQAAGIEIAEQDGVT